jgi:hypothetical protein
MFLSKRTLLGAVLGLLIAAPMARAQNEGVEPLARGPIHEAYAMPVEGSPSQGRTIDREPPAPIEEVPADQKPEGDNVLWMPGYWAFDDGKEDFVWISGFWRVPPPGRSWVPGSWRQTGAQWQWTAGFWAAADTPDMHYLPPPPTNLESGPSTPAPAEDYIYTPGSWVYTSSHYAWRPGMWVMHRPGWVWIPAHFRWTPAGYVFVDGYWDYPLAHRGILFAPVWIDVRYAYRPRWYFSPTIAVYDDALYGSLFVRAGYSGYVFGDYFEARYTTLGYRSWFSISFGRGYAYDPLFVYYRASYRSDPFWDRGIREVYVARYRGDIPRPPVTIGVNVNINFMSNPTIINKYPNLVKTQNITNVTNVNNTVINIKNVQNNTNVTNNVSMAKFTKLQPVTAAQKQTFIADSRKITDVGKARVASETKLAAGGVPMKSTDAPRTAKLDIPKPLVSATTGTGTGNKNAPPPPAVIHKPTNPVITGGSNNNAGNAGTGNNNKPMINEKPILPTNPGTLPKTGTGDKPPITIPPLEKPKAPSNPPPPPPEKPKDKPKTGPGSGPPTSSQISPVGHLLDPRNSPPSKPAPKDNGKNKDRDSH